MKTKVLSFEVSREDARIIREIARRASLLATEHGVEYAVADAEMDLTACHANGMPLDLQKLLTADNGNFGHDVFGIRRHLDRTTGQLKDCFVPRFAA